MIPCHDLTLCVGEPDNAAASIVAAFPIGAVIVMIAVSFMKDAKKYMENVEEKGQQEVDNVDNEK